MKTKPITVSLLLMVSTTVALTTKAAHADRCSDARRIDSTSTSPSASSSSSSSSSASASSSASPASPQPPEAIDEECIERNIYWMPGTFGTFFSPSAKGVGPFYGGGVQFAPYQWSHNNDHFGPSQGSLFFQAALLTSPDGKGTLALFEAGATASFERNSSRRIFIPYFGGTMGGLSHSELGTSAYAYPLGGIHLYWHHNLMIDAEGGYHFPFSDIDRVRGPRAQLSARFSLW